MKKVDNVIFTYFAKELIQKRKKHFCNSLLKTKSIEYLNSLIDFLFPHFSSKVYYYEEDIISKLQLLKRDLIELLQLLNGQKPNNIDKISTEFIEKLPKIHNTLWEDAEFIFNNDPAAESIDEVVLTYPGFISIVIYRLAHELYLQKIPIIPRILTEHAHQLTGIDIHPGATIDSPFFIDHGTGIVIGETTVIGKNVKIYQGVTLGALSVEKSLAQTKRHPTIEDNVVVYAQAVILGGNTIIGKNSIIGGNSWITQSIPENSIVYNKSEVKVRSNINLDYNFDFII